MSPLSKRMQLFGSFAVGAVAAAAVLMLATHGPVNARMPAAPSAAPQVLQPQSALDALRREADQGDDVASRLLAGELMDRFDQTGDPDALYEAMIWIDRHRDTSGKVVLAARVLSHYCGNRVVRWHWLCVAGE